MQRFRLASSLVAIGLVASSATSYAYSLDFVMENRTNQPIVVFMASRTTESKYLPFDDVYVRPNGGRQRFTFSYTAVGNDCYHDMKLKFQSGKVATLNHISLCSVNTLIIDVENGKVVYDTN